MSDAGFKHSFFRIFFVDVHGIEVAGNPGIENDVRFSETISLMQLSMISSMVFPAMGRISVPFFVGNFRVYGSGCSESAIVAMLYQILIVSERVRFLLCA